MGATFGTKLFTRMHGQRVGEDAAGNVYYRERKSKAGQRERRWVIYAEVPEASSVPPVWQGWLTHTLAESPIEEPPVARPWQSPREASLTGTAAVYYPPCDQLAGGKRDRTTGDYEAWTPE